ncbi:MAG: hypothetical protein DRJ05_10520 [Bacteroidetes bacterium]|nr:MAG: hypothetical protein DRJ05_10520 [Bacteroidota bacterium]
MIKLSNPPIIEVVIGVQFSSPLIDNKLIYDCYQLIKESFPEIKENPILPSIIENIDGPNQENLLTGFHSRKWFVNSEGHKLIQLQPDRLLFNWRKSNSEKAYPHFQNVLGEFMQVFSKFDHICSFKELINQLEITYVDHIYLDDFNLKNFEINSIFNFWNFPKPLKNITNIFSFGHPEINGVINVNIQSAISNIDQRKLITCSTTCRGMFNEDQDMQQWFDLSHDIIIDLFTDLISDKAKQIWGFKKL